MRECRASRGLSRPGLSGIPWWPLDAAALQGTDYNDRVVEYTYHPRILEELAGFGLRPRASTPPPLAKEFVNDLYRHELRRLRKRLRKREIPKEGYADRVVALRKKYFLLSIRLDLWARAAGSGETGARPGPDQAMVTSGDR